MADVVFRRYEPGDQAAALALFNAVFAAPIDPGHWRWKLAANPAGPALRAVALHEGTLVGHLAFNPVRVLVDRRIVRGLQAVDVVADPGRWGLGTGLLVTRLWKWLERTIPAAGEPSFIFGFPTPRFQPLTARVLDGVEACQVLQWVRVRNPAYLGWRLARGRPGLQRRLLALGTRLRGAGRPAATGPGEGPAVRRVTGFDAGFDRLWDEAAPGLEVAAVRDRRYLAWRYAHPAFATYAVQERGRTHGFVVLRTGTWEGWRVGYVADLLAPDAATGRRLIRAALAHCRSEGVDLVRAWMLAHSGPAALLRAARFRARPSPTRLMVRELPATSWGWAALQDGRRWYVTLGDSDGV